MTQLSILELTNDLYQAQMKNALNDNMIVGLK